jgi:FtsZ-binding cell division protein ZapB
MILEEVMLMANEKKRVTSVYLDEDILEHCKTNALIQSFSIWANDKYREQFMSAEALKEKKARLSKELKYINTQLKEVPKDNTTYGVKKEHLNWIKNEGIERIARSTMKGVLSYFNNQFGYRLNTRQFRILIEAVTPNRK